MCVPKFRKRACGEQTAAVDDGQAVAEALGFAHDVSAEHDTLAVVAQGGQLEPLEIRFVVVAAGVWSAMRSAGSPSRSFETPMMRPGMFRLNRSCVARNAAWGPP